MSITSTEIYHAIERLQHPDHQKIQDNDPNNGDSINSRQIPPVDDVMIIPGIDVRPDPNIPNAQLRDRTAQLLNTLKKLELYQSTEMQNFYDSRQRANPQNRMLLPDLHRFDPEENVDDNGDPDLDTLTNPIYDSYDRYTNTTGRASFNTYRARVLQAVEQGQPIPEVPALVAVYPIGQDEIDALRQPYIAFRAVAVAIEQDANIPAGQAKRDALALFNTYRARVLQAVEQGQPIPEVPALVIDALRQPYIAFRAAAVAIEQDANIPAGQAKRDALAQHATAAAIAVTTAADRFPPVPKDEWATRRDDKVASIFARMQALAIYFAIVEAHESGRDPITGLHRSLLQSTDTVSLTKMGYKRAELQRWLNTLNLEQLNNGLSFLNLFRQGIQADPNFEGPLQLPISEGGNDHMVEIPADLCKAMKLVKFHKVKPVNGQPGDDFHNFQQNQVNNFDLPPLVSDYRRVEKYATDAKTLADEAKAHDEAVSTAAARVRLTTGATRFFRGFTEAAAEGANNANDDSLDQHALIAKQSYNNCVRPANNANPALNREEGYMFQADALENSATARSDDTKQASDAAQAASTAATNAHNTGQQNLQNGQNVSAFNNDEDDNTQIEFHVVAAREALATAKEHHRGATTCRTNMQPIEQKARAAEATAENAFNAMLTSLAPSRKAAEAHTFAENAKNKAELAEKIAKQARLVANALGDEYLTVTRKTDHRLAATRHATLTMTYAQQVRAAAEEAAQANLDANTARRHIINAIDLADQLAGIAGNAGQVDEPIVSNLNADRNNPNSLYSKIRDSVSELVRACDEARGSATDATTMCAAVIKSRQDVEAQRVAAVATLRAGLPTQQWRADNVQKAGNEDVRTSNPQVAPQTPAPLVQVGTRNVAVVPGEPAVVNQHRQTLHNRLIARRNAC